jgi:hypothetical protein
LLGRFEQVFESRKPDVDFRIVYIRDTHPALGFRAPTNDRRGIPPEQEPKSVEDREKWACEDRKKMKCSIPVVMDTFDDKTLKAYDAFPQRVFVLDKDGKVAYVSSGLSGMEAGAVEKALDALKK